MIKWFFECSLEIKVPRPSSVEISIPFRPKKAKTGSIPSFERRKGAGQAGHPVLLFPGKFLRQYPVVLLDETHLLQLLRSPFKLFAALLSSIAFVGGSGSLPYRLASGPSFLVSSLPLFSTVTRSQKHLQSLALLHSKAMVW